jgi:tetratricopeptide (TPR) repeat protein
VPQVLIDRAMELMKSQRFGEALPLLCLSIDEDPSQWNVWYLAGQCSRFMNDIDGAIEYLKHATELKADEAPIFLAFGIALQLRMRWDDAVKAFRRD